MSILASIDEARKRGASVDQILSEIERQNPDKTPVFQAARQRGAAADAILSEIEHQNFLKRLSAKESSGKYTALGPVVSKGMYQGDRAYGKYQIMGKNIPSWTKQYLGKSMTPEDFLKDATAQDTLMRKRAEEQYKKFGNWADVASVHFTGKPAAQGAKAKDDLGTTGEQYVSDVYGAPFPASPGDSPLAAGLKAVGNTPASAINLGKGLVQAATNPMQTLRGVGEALGGGIKKAAVALGATDTPVFSPEQDAQNEATFNALSSMLKQRYGSFEALQETATNDPFAFGTDIVGLLAGGATLAGKGALAAKTVSKAGGAVTKPITTAASSVADKVSNTIRFGASQATGLDTDTISTAIARPAALSAAQKSGLNRATLAEDVKSTIDKRIEELSDLGKGYETVRTAGTTVTLPEGWFVDILAKHKLDISPDGKISGSKESTVLNPADINALQNFYDVYAKDPVHTPNSFLNTREALAQLAKYDATKTGNLQSVARDARSELNRYRNQVDGLKELDDQYAPEVEELNAIKKEWIDPKTGELKDSALSRIANATNDTNAKRLERLETIQPGITQQIKVLRAVEDIEKAQGIKVGTYSRTLTQGVGVAGALTGNIPAVIAAIISQPEIALPLIKGLGYSKNKLAPILQQLRQAAGDINNFRLPAGAQPGLIIKSDTSIGVSPASVAQKINGEDIPLIQNYVNDPSLDNLMKLQPILEPMGIEKLDPAMLQRFLSEVVQERNKTEGGMITGEPSRDDKTRSKQTT